MVPGRKSKISEVEARFGESIETLIRRYYYDKEYNLDELAALFRVSRTTVWTWMLKLGLPTRTWQIPPGFRKEAASGGS